MIIGLFSAQWTPFAGMNVKGRVKRVVLRDQVVFLDGKLLAHQGQGQDIRKSSSTPNAKRVKLELLSPPQTMSTEPIKLSDLRPTSPFPMTSTSILELNSFKNKHVLNVSMFNRQMLSKLFHNVDNIKNAFAKGQPSFYNQVMKDKVLASVFYEPSTRTMASFNVAMKRLGGEVCIFQRIFVHVHNSNTTWWG